MSQEQANLESNKEDQKPKGGMVFYPREYSIVDNIDESFSRGVNLEGEECVVYVRPTEAARAAANESGSAKTIPTLMEFAEDGRRAKNPCFSSIDNSQENPEGVMLVEQVIKDEELTKKHELPVYVGRWASVLRDSSEMPKVPVGPGYIEVGFNPKVDSQTNEYMTQYKELKAEMDAGVVENMIDAEERRVSLYHQIMAGRKKWFVTVMLRHKEIFSLSEITEGSLRSSIEPILNKYTICGMYGGVIVRVRSGDSVISQLSNSCNMQYDYKNGEPFSSEYVINNFMTYFGNKIIREANSNGYVVDIIPTIRINCGPQGSQKMNSQFETGGTAKVLKTYVDKDFHDNPEANYVKEKAFLFAHIAVRLHVIGKNRSGAGNYLMSSVHAYSAPKGNILTIDVNGKSVYKMDNSKDKDFLQNAA